MLKTTPSSPKEQAPRALRADAQRNYDLLVAAADAEFTEAGADASLERIAERAGVGIGTLYRHFPTRDDLLAKVLFDSTMLIVGRGRALLERGKPGDQLIAWLRDLVVYVTTYRGMTAALANSYIAKTGTNLCQGCDEIAKVGDALLKRAQRAGEVRADAEVREVILSAHAAAWIGEQTKDPKAVERMLAILFDGLRVVAPKRTRKSTSA
jgi:AcrR family transcriptional regulator